jgi:hypothetical protein
MIQVLLIGGPCDGERHDISGALSTLRVPMPTKDTLGFPRRRPPAGSPEEIPELFFEHHDYVIISLYGHYLGVSVEMRTDEALSALIRRYPRP